MNHEFLSLARVRLCSACNERRICLRQPRIGQRKLRIGLHCALQRLHGFQILTVSEQLHSLVVSLNRCRDFDEGWNELAFNSFSTSAETERFLRMSSPACPRYRNSFSLAASISMRNPILLQVPERRVDSNLVAKSGVASPDHVSAFPNSAMREACPDPVRILG